MSEWPKEHAWKVCISQGIEGSTPSLTAKFSQGFTVKRKPRERASRSVSGIYTDWLFFVIC